MNIKISLFLAITFVLSFVDTTTKNEWELRRNEEDIKVYTRTISGSNFKAYKSVTTLNTSIDSLINIFKDQENYKDWFEGVAISKHLGNLSENEYVVYLKNPAPWPIADRDVITVMQFVDETSEKVKILMRAKPNHIEENESTVRISYVKGSWTFMPMANGTVKVIHQAHVEPGGSLPAWLANSTVVDFPFKTMRNLKRIIQH